MARTPVALYLNITQSHTTYAALWLSTFLLCLLWQVVLFVFYVGLATCAENYSLTKIDELDDIFAHIRFNNIHIASNGGLSPILCMRVSQVAIPICFTTKMP